MFLLVLVYSWFVCVCVSQYLTNKSSVFKVNTATVENSMEVPQKAKNRTI